MALTESLYTKVKKGDAAPGFTLPDLEGKQVSLDAFKGKPTLVVFMCNHCPYVVHKIGTIVALDKEFPDLQVVGINSNDVINYPHDSPEKMKEFAQEKGIGFPYLFDESQEVSRAWGASCTPDPFLLDAELKLAYHGRFDDALEPGTTATTQEMKDAILELLAGKPVTVQEKVSIGCSIKWKA